MRAGGKVWVPSAAWIVAAAASPLVAMAVSAGDLTAIPLLFVFVVVGVLGIPLGVALGRLGVLREAAVTAALAALTATAVCAVQSFELGVQWTAGGTVVFVVLVAFLFAILALPLPAIGFVIGWALRKRRG
ncbi:hypothetical protein [Streptomyces sp. H39-C1]|uniref:hypothetical protein n=1 Tax=Streptomyces sp. H39-C1 TaxID=3004355 RepID=UPI0022AE8494|nr:hypothetical protein [Streptomyces sp. H39-C1]MCZ4097127.1 hypothetical protein [Streptomyces sp. H39-C1]